MESIPIQTQPLIYMRLAEPRCGGCAPQRRAPQAEVGPLRALGAANRVHA